jgi:hypothetical protein
MRFPVDTSAMSFVSAGPAVPSVDYDTKQQKIDANGVPINQVDLFGVSDGSREVITVKVSGEARGLGQFTPVKVTDLVLATWTVKNSDGTERSGVSFTASKIETVSQRAASS